MRIIRFVLVGILAAGLFFFYIHSLSQRPRSQKTGTSPQSAKEEKKFIPRFLFEPREEIQNFTLQRKGLRMKVKKDEASWRIVSPVQGTVQGQFLYFFFKKMHEIVLTDSFRVRPSEFSTFALKPALYEFAFTSTLQPKERTLLIGSETPTGSLTYAAWKGESRVYLIKGDIKSLLKTPLALIRTPRLFSYSQRELEVVERFEMRSEKTSLAAEYLHGTWYRVPKQIVMDTERVSDFLKLFFNLQIKGYSDSDPVPEIPEKYFLKLDRGKKPPWVLWFGKLNRSKQAYPVHFPAERLRVWIDAKILEPLLGIPEETLDSKRFVEFSVSDVSRLKVMNSENEASFIYENKLWHQEIEGRATEPFEALDTLMTRLQSLEYLKRLDANEKSALLFDAAEVGLEIYLYRKGESEPFCEFKFYVRDYIYLEINNSPPLYVLPKRALEPLLDILKPFLG